MQHWEYFCSNNASINMYLKNDHTLKMWKHDMESWRAAVCSLSSRVPSSGLKATGAFWTKSLSMTFLSGRLTSVVTITSFRLYCSKSFDVFKTFH